MRRPQISLLLPLQNLPWLWRATVSLLPTVFVLSARPILPPILSQTPAVMHYPAAIIAAWVGGLFPGVASTLLCSAYSLVYLRPHLLVDPAGDPKGVLRSLMFLSTSLFFTFLITSMQRALRRAREAVELRDEFLSLASHELKTPITSLFLRSQMREKKAGRALAQSVGLAPEDMHKMAHADLRDLTRLNQLIDNMLDVTRLTLGKRPFAPVDLDLSETVTETVQRFQQVHPGAIELSIGPAIRGQFDLLQIEQVLMNLLSNAVKYGDKKPVRVTLASPTPGQARIEVHDKGPGIAPEFHGRVFQKFERLQPKDKISGLGLGLYICRELVRRHGGSIDFTSEPGQGTTFRVDLPLLPAAS